VRVVDPFGREGRAPHRAGVASGRTARRQRLDAREPARPRCPRHGHHDLGGLRALRGAEAEEARDELQSKDFVIVAIALDDNKKMVKIFGATFEIPYYLGTVEDRAESRPRRAVRRDRTHTTSILLDRDGTIAARMDGVWPDGILERAVDRLVAGAHASH